MTRVFDAPRRLVFEAHTKCEHLKHCEMDFRPGGAWRFVLRRPDGNQYGFRGEFREIKPPERIVWTFEFEGRRATYRPRRSRSRNATARRC